LLRLPRRDSLRNRLIGLLLGVVIAGVILAFSPHASAPVLRSSFLRIVAHLMWLHCNNTKASAQDLRPALSGLSFRHRSFYKGDRCLGDKADAVDFKTFLQGFPTLIPTGFKMVVVGAPITGWCKDRFLVTSSTPAILLRRSRP